MGMIQRAGEFIKEVRIESTKVTWPTRRELWESTIVVVVSVIFVSVFTGLVDRVFSFFLGFVVR